MCYLLFGLDLCISSFIFSYTKKTQLEHILLRPDTYIGSIERHNQNLWVLDNLSKRVVNRQVSYVPGLYKIFDEIIVNAADNKQRDPTMNRIEVTIAPSENMIRVWNNGNGIPIVMHQEHKVYVPELIFGHLLTGSNFDDKEEKTTGGRNGYGAKLANIFSRKFIIETADSSRGLRYKQVFENNMSRKGEPEISKFSGTDFTCVSFFPDLSRFHMDTLDQDIVSLMEKRVYDMAGTVISDGSKLNVHLNGQKIDIKSFQQYISLYDGVEAPCAFEKINDRWEIGVGMSDGSFQQVSFVNSICTSKGGTHVNYIADQITSKLVGIVKKKNKGQEVKPNQIKNHLAIYVNSLIVNPSFDSQTKENMTTKMSAFGSTCAVSEKMMKAVEKSGIIEAILNWAKFKQNAELKKKSGSKRSKVLGITKLDDANNAGTSKSRDCTLILTEGDSAKALAISGLSVVGRDFFGVFPLKGKLLNVREASHAQILKNEEIQNLVKILGLTFGKTYEDTSSLRYGHLMIMTDQDHDGSHIKGLLINFIHHFWPSLLKIDGFLQQFITPIVKCTKGKQELSFFTLPEYQQWKLENNDGKNWKIKYYKGLGTSTSQEAKEYFTNIDTHKIDFEWNGQSDDAIDMAFAKKRVDDRKMWLLGLEPGLHIDYDVDSISYDEFVNKELILFSHADNERSVPHFMDGFKPSQRKVIFGCFKRNLRNEIKVAQLAGYISEHAAYHHGEASLTQTIIGMAQNFVGSNNINLLSPCGQFGTRLMGGKDAASPRYVFTKLENIARSIFHPDDDPLLNFLDDDGQQIEPEYYVPVIPMALVNGSEGIGTGWSTSVPNYNPRDIIHNIRLMLRGERPQEMTPWYRGFGGEVLPKTGKDAGNFLVSGSADLVDDSTVVITELPVGKWTTDYKQMLESVMIGNTAAAEKKEDGSGGATVAAFVKDFKENHTDTSVLFTVTIPAEKIQEISQEKGGLQKKLKLDTSISTTNMNMFNSHGIIHKFENTVEIMDDFYRIRLQFYIKRKDYLLNKLTNEWEKLDNKVRFIQAVIQGSLVVSNRKKNELLLDLKKRNFRPFWDKIKAQEDQTAENEQDEEAIDNTNDLDKGYDYLLGMKLWSLTQEKVNELLRQRDEKQHELERLKSKTAEDLWKQDLDNLEVALDDFDAKFENSLQLDTKMSKKSQKDSRSKPNMASKSIKKIPSKTSKADDDDESGDDSMDFEEDDDFIVDDSDDEPSRSKKTKGKANSKVVASKTKPLSIKSSNTSKAPVNIKTLAPPSVTTSSNDLSVATTTTKAKAVKSTAEGRGTTTMKPIAPLSKAATIPSTTVTNDIVEENPYQTMSLLARLKLNSVSQSSLNPEIDVFKIHSNLSSSNATTSVPSTTTTTASSSSGKMSKSLSVGSKPAATKPRAKKTKKEDSEDEIDLDDFDSHDEESEDYSESEDSEDDFSSKAKKRSVGQKSVLGQIASISNVAPNKGVKRKPKGSQEVSSSNRILYSPGAHTPQPKKKSKSRMIPEAKILKKSKKIEDSEEEDEVDDDESVEEVVVKRTPKPSRARKTINYAKYEEDSEGSVDSDDESDAFVDSD